MQSALAATLTTPEWWAMALAGFLLRGGFVLVLLPIIALPTPAGFITDVSPTVESVLMGTPTLAGALLGAVALTALACALTWLGMAGAWFDAALVRDAATSDELDLAWEPATDISTSHALGLRLAAHLPTAIAFAYGLARVVGVSYEQFTAPDQPGVPVVDRVIGRVPDAILLVVVAWLLGEAVGGLAARRAAAGQSNGAALLGSFRQVVSPRGLATFTATTALLLAAAVPFALAVERAWEHVRSYLLFGVDAIQLTAAIVVLVATWVLGLTITGAALAWRATAWTTEMTAEERARVPA
jgi:hypothetical protein